MIYDRIVKICNARGLSITKLEDMAGLGHGTIGKWKTSDPQIGNLRKVASALNMTVDELVKEE